MSGKSLRHLLDTGKTLVMPGAYNAFGARQLARMGFDGVYISGAGLANSLGLPDDGTLALDDFLYLGRWIAEAVDVPVICDADTGFEDIEETVRKYIEAGFSGMQVEDQVLPKRCGHLAGKEVVGREEMGAKIEKAAAVRDQLDPEFILIGRTDVRGAENIAEKDQLEESMARANFYQRAGVDMVFPESLRNKGEFATFRSRVSGYLMANMTEFGKTDFITVKEFEEMKFNLVIFPVSLFRFHAGQTQRFLARLKELGSQETMTPDMMTRTEINSFLNYEP
ncbi:MAG: oxaloacetate decarboxylase [Nitrospinaceae bacterium]